MRSRSLLSLAAAAALAASLPGAALAQSVPETLTVPASLTVTGVPASIDYGSVSDGTQSAVVNFRPIISSNGTVTFDASGGDFTSGGDSIGQDAREWQFSGDFNWATNNPPGTNAWVTTSTVEGVSPVGGCGGFCDPTSGQFDIDLRVNVPADSPPGAYSSSITLTFTAS